jgi:hypothetical protein
MFRMAVIRPNGEFCRISVSALAICALKTLANEALPAPMKMSLKGVRRSVPAINEQRIIFHEGVQGVTSLNILLRIEAECPTKVILALIHND